MNKNTVIILVALGVVGFTAGGVAGHKIRKRIEQKSATNVIILDEDSDAPFITVHEKV